MPRTLKQAYPSHMNKEAINSSPEVKPRWLMKLCPCLGGYPMTINYVSIAPLTVLIGGIQCLYDDAWFYDLDWFVSLQWVLVYCGSYICNDISCLVGFFCCIPHLLVTFLRLYIMKRRKWRPHQRHQQANATATVTIKKWASLRKEDITLLPTLCLLLSHLVHSDEYPNDQDKMRNKYFIPIDKKGMTAYLPR
jgi:hypothetical protein